MKPKIVFDKKTNRYSVISYRVHWSRPKVMKQIKSYNTFIEAEHGAKLEISFKESVQKKIKDIKKADKESKFYIKKRRLELKKLNKLLKKVG